jgi:hypothetical protein
LTVGDVRPRGQNQKTQIGQVREHNVRRNNPLKIIVALQKIHVVHARECPPYGQYLA